MSPKIRDDITDFRDDFYLNMVLLKQHWFVRAVNLPPPLPRQARGSFLKTTAGHGDLIHIFWQAARQSKIQRGNDLVTASA